MNVAWWCWFPALTPCYIGMAFASFGLSLVWLRAMPRRKGYITDIAGYLKLRCGAVYNSIMLSAGSGMLCWMGLPRRKTCKTPVCAGWCIRCRDVAAPPDVFSQTLLAILCCLFDRCLLLTLYVGKGRNQEENDAEQAKN